MTGIIVVAGLFIGLFLIAQLFIFVGGAVSKDNLSKVMDEACDKYDIPEKKRIIFKDGNGLLFGHNGVVVYFLENKDGRIGYEGIAHQHIDYEVVLGENVVSRKNILDTTGKAVVGGVLFGGIGAIAGLLLGSSRSESKFNRVGIRLRMEFDDQYIITNDLLMDTGRASVKGDSALYEHAMEELDYIIHEIEKNNRREV